MKHKSYVVWSVISVVAVFTSLGALVPVFTIGFADAATRTAYIVAFASLVVFAFVSLFLTIIYRGKNPDEGILRAGAQARKYTIISLLMIVIFMMVFSAINS